MWFQSPPDVYRVGCCGDTPKGKEAVAVGFMVTGEIDGVITHASAKAIAIEYSDPSDVVSGFVHHGQIYGEPGDLWHRLMLGINVDALVCDTTQWDRGETRLRELLKAYIDARYDRGECGPVAGWPGMDVARRYAPWDINVYECLTCGGDSRECTCGLECLDCGEEKCECRKEK